MKIHRFEFLSGLSFLDTVHFAAIRIIYTYIILRTVSRRFEIEAYIIRDRINERERERVKERSSLGDVRLHIADGTLNFRALVLSPPPPN